MSSAGLFGRLLMNVSKASFMALTNLSFFRKQMSMMWSTLSLKSSSSCTIVLSFSGLITIVLPKACWKLILKTSYLIMCHHQNSGAGWRHRLLRLQYLYILYPVLQQHLNATSHSTEELIEKRQILNSVLIQQMSQPWTESRRSEAVVRQGGQLSNVALLTNLYKNFLVCTFLQGRCEMFTQQLLLHRSNEWFSGGKEAEVTYIFINVKLQSEYQSVTHCVLWSRYVMTLSASSSKRLLTWWRYSGT